MVQHQCSMGEYSWLDRLPQGWSVRPLKRVARVRGGVTKGRDLSAKTTVELPYLRVANVQAGHLALDEIKMIEITIDEMDRYRLMPGDILMNEGGDFDKLGRGAVWHGEIDDCLHQNHVFAVRPFDTGNSDWISLNTLSDHLQHYFILHAKQTTNLASISSTNLSEAPIIWPPSGTRSAILHFLDHRTAAIDALIEKKERLVALLAEKRAALIHRAVTRGLDPDAPMKDSGVPWIGEIPAYWEIKRLKRISPSQTVGVVVNPSSYVDPKGTIPFIYGSEVLEGRVDTSTARRITEVSNQNLRKSQLHAGDLACVRVGDPGITAVIPPELDGINCASIMIVRGHPSFNSEWLCHAMNSSVGRQNVWLVAYGAAQKQYNIGHAVDFVYPVPPRIEQDHLVKHMNEITERHAKAVERLQTQIAKLHEYRQSLITAAVTGQIDVRSDSTAGVPRGFAEEVNA